MRPSVRITAIRPLLLDTGHDRTFLFVLVDTDAGLTGVGEGSQNDQDAAVVANMHQLAPRYVGQNPLDLIEARGLLLSNDRTGRAMFVAVSAIEQALWVLAGKLLDVPVYQLLGGSSRDRLRCYATMGAGLTDRSPDGQAQEAVRCTTAGFTGVKLGPFGELTPELLKGSIGRQYLNEGSERVKAVRIAVGSDVEVMIECGYVLDFPSALRIAEALTPHDCFWLEAPLLWDDPLELAHLRHTIPQRVASGERTHGRRAYRELIEARALDVLQPDVKWTGGILEAKKIAAWAETYQLTAAPHNNSGPVATAASAHLSITLPNFLILETPSQAPSWEAELLCGTSLVVNGEVSLDCLRARTGLGVEFDEAVARRYEHTL